MEFLQIKVPLLFDILKESGPIPSNYKLIFRGIYEKSVNTFSKSLSTDDGQL